MFCRNIPSKGTETFIKLEDILGYDSAKEVFLTSIDPKFLQDFKDSLSLDAEGVPSFDSIISNPYIKRMIGDTKMLTLLNSDYKPKEDTIVNYDNLLQEALDFNKNSPEKGNYVATVEYTKENQLKVQIHTKTKELNNKFNDQYSANELNKKLVNILKPAGVTIGELSKAEVGAGRVGVTKFQAATNIANSSIVAINIANNREGSEIFSEEFSHVMLGVFNKEPLVQRALNLLENEKTLQEVLGKDYNDVFDFYNGDLSLMAEEAAGTVLNKAIKKEYVKTPLIKRLLNFITNKFKNIDSFKISNAVVESNSLMSSLAKDILSEAKKITPEDIKNNKRTIELNALSDRVERNIEILKEAAKTELKRFQITKGTSKEKASKLKNKIIKFTAEDADTVLGLYEYAKSAISELKELQKEFLSIDTKSNSQIFGLLRRARSYVQSYASFIDRVQSALIEEEGLKDDMFKIIIEKLNDEQTKTLKDVYKELSEMSNYITAKYSKIAKDSLLEFYKPFFGDKLTKVLGADKKPLTLEQVLKEAERDISFIDKWLDSMGDSSDLLIQLMDYVVKQGKDTAREDTIKLSKHILRLVEKADSYNIKDFEWMFEVDDEGNFTGNYISEIDYAKFSKNLTKLEETLTEVYGRNPSGHKADLKIEARENWLNQNTNRMFGQIKPKPEKYINQTFKNLSPQHLEIYEEFLKIKKSLDALLPETRTSSLKAIQIRKSSGQRLLDSITSPTSLMTNLQEQIGNALLDKEDDDQIFGENLARKGLTDFSGREFLTLPVLYTTKLKNPNELNTDIFSTLLSYAYSSNIYKQMDKIIDPLEVTKTLAEEDRKVRKSRGDKALVEKFDALNVSVVSKIFHGSNTNIVEKINTLLESKVYNKYLKDEGTFNLFGKKFNTSKFTSAALKWSSQVSLGFNYLSNIANATTGVAMQNIEAIAGEFFNVSELAFADKEYIKELKNTFSELGKRIKTNKLDLFGEFFNIKQDFSDKIKNNKKRNLLLKIFGENIAFLGQTMGDHWLYNRTAIAMAKKEKVKVKKPKKVKKVNSLNDAQNVVKQIIKDSNNLTLNSEEEFYINKTNNKTYARVTSIINKGKNTFSSTHPDGSPNNWILPSNSIGIGMDELVRDFFNNKFIKNSNGKWETQNTENINLIYPNSNKQDLNDFLNNLANLKTRIKDKGLTVVPRDIVVEGNIQIQAGRKIKKINVAGTLDLLAYDKDGNFYIYDMKTLRSKVSESKRQKWSKQLSLYKQLLEQKYGITVKEMNIIPMKVSYDTPIGESDFQGEGTAEYTVDTNGQLYNNDKKVTSTRPILLGIQSLDEVAQDFDFADLNNNEQAINNSIDDGEYTEMSLWEALQIRKSFENSNVSEMFLPEGTLDSEGNLFNAKEFGRKIAKVNQGLFGIYNDEDSNAANRVTYGRLLMQYRRWMVPQYNKRFRKKRVDLLLESEEEGYYVTTFRILNELRRGEIQLGRLKEQLSEKDYAHLKRTITELTQFYALFALIRLIDWGDDKKRPYAAKFAEYVARRLEHELGGLAVTHITVDELLKTFKTPIAMVSTLQDLVTFISSTLNPYDYMNTLQSGPYKGLNNVQKNFIKAPIPIISYYRQIDRTLNQIDNNITYYIRSW